ncbi:hypothetical protein P167DRAFT_571909 [Morchella conica CCBAS932]|uniref:Uncharacterized protein n=1 Tax=Morchella conica CCBAS932 TaxID=1392247 RepID=A0A3N4KWW0_9PEZI|nr:hypothetical protein P167DRAFT_571909 [Morchella conica CCBAS932]
MSARGRRKVLFVRTRYRTRGFSPPPSPMGLVDGAGTDHNIADPTLPSPAVVEAGTSPGFRSGAGEAVAVPKSAATITDVTAEENMAAGALGEIPPTKRAKVEEEFEPSNSDEHIAYIAVTTSPRAISPAAPDPATPAICRSRRTRSTGTYMRSHSSPIQPFTDSGSGPGAEPISAMDAALIEISNDRFFNRHRIHEAAVAHQVACESALERVKQHRRLGTRPDDWDEDLALEGLPPLQRWKKRFGLEEEEKENWY